MALTARKYRGRKGQRTDIETWSKPMAQNLYVLVRKVLLLICELPEPIKLSSK